MTELSRRTFLALGVGGVAWACGGRDEAARTGTPPPATAEPGNALSVVRVAPETAIGDRRAAFGLFQGRRPLPADDVRSLVVRLHPPEGEAVRLEPRIEAVDLGTGGEELDAHEDHDHEHGPDAHRLVAVDHAFDAPGTWRAEVVVDLPEGTQRAEAAFEVVSESRTVMVGERAIAVASPTRDEPLDADPYCTRRPVCSMHERSVADAVGSGRPAVIVFATPAFCTSQVCGPVVDILEALHRERGEEADFVHVEVWKNPEVVGEPDGLVDAFREWKLDTEPWTFFVDADGTVRDRWSGPAGLATTREAVEGLIAGEL